MKTRDRTTARHAEVGQFAVNNPDLSYREISQHFGICTSHSKYILKKLGIEHTRRSAEYLRNKRIEKWNSYKRTYTCACGCGRIPNFNLQGSSPNRYCFGHAGAKATRISNRVLINEETGCWEWQLAKQDGYGITRFNGKPEKAHRVAYKQKYGIIPEGTVIDHLCLNRGCVNPDHLQAVITVINTQRGERVKVTPEQVIEIRRKAAEGFLQKDLAQEYNQSRSLIADIVRRDTWKNLP